MRRTLGIAVAAVLFGSPGQGHGQAAPVDSLALARQYTQWLYEGAVDSLVAHSSDRAREGFATPSGYKQSSNQIAVMAGEEVSIVEEGWKLRNGDCQYWRVAMFSSLDDLLLVRWVLRDDGVITGLGVGPNAQAPPVDRETCDAGP